MCHAGQAARLDLGTRRARMLCPGEEWAPSHRAVASCQEPMGSTGGWGLRGIRPYPHRSALARGAPVMLGDLLTPP